MLRHIFTSLLLLLTVPILRAESFATTGGEWTLDSCINYALSHNLTIKAREYDRVGAEVALAGAKDKYLPHANAYAGQNFSFGRGLNSENTYSNRNTSTFNWGAQIQMPLFQGLSAVRGVELAKVSLRQMVCEVEAAKDDVTLNVISRYLQVLYADELTSVARLRLHLSEVELDRRTALLEAGKIPELDVIQAEAQVAQDELSVVNASNDRALALLDLAQMLQLLDTVGFRIVPLERAPLPPMDPDEIYARAMQSNASVLAARTGIEVADKSIAQARTGYLPTLSLSAGIGSSYYRLSGLENEGFGNQMRHNLSETVGLSLSIPLFDAFNTRRNISRAKVQRLNARLQLETVGTQLYKAIQNAYYQAVGAEKKREVSRTAAHATEKAFEAMTAKYECGRANATELEQAKTDYLRALTEEIQARYESHLRLRILTFYNR